MAKITSSTVGRKIVMATSAMLLLGFLIVHWISNILSIDVIFGPNAYNIAADFLGYNPFVQFLLQPILIAGVVVHFVMGFVLEINNRKARPIQYGYNNWKANSSLASHSMIISGGVILLFLILHFYDFWIHEMDYKAIEQFPRDPGRYLNELHAKFADLTRVIIYCVSFLLLGLHLSHGFQTSFQSMGINKPKLTQFLLKTGKIYAIVIPAGFIIIAIYHYVTNLG